MLSARWLRCAFRIRHRSVFLTLHIYNSHIAYRWCVPDSHSSSTFDGLKRTTAGSLPSLLGLSVCVCGGKCATNAVRQRRQQLGNCSHDLSSYFAALYSLGTCSAVSLGDLVAGLEAHQRNCKAERQRISARAAEFPPNAALDATDFSHMFDRARGRHGRRRSCPTPSTFVSQRPARRRRRRRWCC
eukprot:SAG31_NODE_3680_length_3993_cov_1.941463_2_plen_186_part_00